MEPVRALFIRKWTINAVDLLSQQALKSPKNTQKTPFCKSKEQITTTIKDGGTDEPNTQIMKAKAMLNKRENAMNYVNAIEQPKKRTAKASRKHTYMIYKMLGEKQEIIGNCLQYNNELATAWAMRELTKNRNHFREGDRCELWMTDDQCKEHKIQGFRRGA